MQTFEDPPTLVDKSLQTTRRFDALKLFVSLQVHGRRFFGRCVEATIDLAAHAAAIGENVGYYGVVTVRELVHDARAARAAARAYGGRGRARTIAKLLVEFGPAEALDAAVVRPLSIGMATAALGGAGVVIGKIAADLPFYVPVVITYEVRRGEASGRPLR